MRPSAGATQVLDTLARTGVASRAEITDAAPGACGVRDAEQGTDDVAAITTLDDILTRMATHESKKTSLLRQLRAWSPDPPT